MGFLNYRKSLQLPLKWNKRLTGAAESYCQSTKLRYKSGKKIHKIVFMENQIEANGE